jgi:glycosyltransferase involved in cell wall biosynthesis
MGAEKLTATFADYLFSQSSEDIEQAIKHKICLPESIFYIGNGIDVARFNPHNISLPSQKKREEVGIKADELVVGIVARLVYEKGYMELFQAAAELTRKFDNVKFLVVGPVENERKDAVNLEMLKELGIEENVIFLGMRKDVAELYSIMDIFVLPSWREGIPRALMEAMAMEVPVVATNIRGCREVVKDGETGLLVPVRNHQALAEAIAILLQDEQKRIEMGKAGRKYILANFTEDAVYQRIIQLYDVVLTYSHTP